MTLANESSTQLTDEQIESWFATGRELLRDGRISAAHAKFAKVAELSPAYPFVRHAVAITLPNSLLIRVDAQIDSKNAQACREHLVDSLTLYPEVSLLLIDFSANQYLTSPGIDLLADLQNVPGLIPKLIDVHPRPAQMLRTLGSGHLIWDDYSCPVCGKDKICIPNFSRRRRHLIELR